MKTNKFKENFISLMEIMDKEELYNLFLDKKALTNNFIELICESNELNKLTNIRNNKNIFVKKEYNFDIKKIDNNYTLGYDDKKNKIKVDILGNEIFSYYDDEEQLQNKMNELIKDERYEDADILYKFMKTCDIKFP